MIKVSPINSHTGAQQQFPGVCVCQELAKWTTSGKRYHKNKKSVFVTFFLRRSVGVNPNFSAAAAAATTTVNVMTNNANSNHHHNVKTT